MYELRSESVYAGRDPTDRDLRRGRSVSRSPTLVTARRSPPGRRRSTRRGWGMGTSEASSFTEASEYVVVASKLRTVGCGAMPLVKEAYRGRPKDRFERYDLLDRCLRWPRMPLSGGWRGDWRVKSIEGRRMSCDGMTDEDCEGRRIAPTTPAARGGSASADSDGRMTCWLRMYEERRGVPMAWPGGVLGGVGSPPPPPPPGMKDSAKASKDELIAGSAPALIMGKSIGRRASSTITMDLLPGVMPMSLTGRCWG